MIVKSVDAFHWTNYAVFLLSNSSDDGGVSRFLLLVSSRGGVRRSTYPALKKKIVTTH